MYNKKERLDLTSLDYKYFFLFKLENLSMQMEMIMNIFS
jgi:hypothetical protein